MNFLFRIIPLLAALAFSASALTEENVNVTRHAKAGGKLIVDVDFGTIDVAPGDNDKVVVNASRKIVASSKEKEAEYFAAAPITVTTDGNNVIVRARHGKEWDDEGRVCNDARYSIHVPSNFDADLKTEGGAITTTNLTGKVKAHTSGGDITAATCEGAIDLETSGGRIEVTDGRGKLRADTSGGAVTVKNFGGDAKLESSGGLLRLANISGKINAETAGGAISAILASPVGDDVRLETLAGAITVVTPPNAALTVDAETAAGHVSSDLPMSTMKADHDSLKGTINGGGKALILRSGAGSIEIVSADKETAQQ